MTADRAKLAAHVRLCRKNLKSSHVKCCARCPFEAIITDAYPDTAALFAAKRAVLRARTP